MGFQLKIEMLFVHMDFKIKIMYELIYMQIAEIIIIYKLIIVIQNYELKYKF